jgi:hypothetical protein
MNYELSEWFTGLPTDLKIRRILSSDRFRAFSLSDASDFDA